MCVLTHTPSLSLSLKFKFNLKVASEMAAVEMGAAEMGAAAERAAMAETAAVRAQVDQHIQSSKFEPEKYEAVLSLQLGSSIAKTLLEEHR